MRSIRLSPWLFFDAPAEYTQLLEQAGFNVFYCRFRAEANPFTPEQAHEVFQSGAENGFLNQAFYPVELTHRNVETFRSLIREALAEQAVEAGLLTLEFNRIFLLAGKEESRPGSS